MPPSVNPEACASCIALSGSKHHSCFKCLLERIPETCIAVPEGALPFDKAGAKSFLDTSFLMGAECLRFGNKKARAVLHNLAMLSASARYGDGLRSGTGGWVGYTERESEDAFSGLPSVSNWMMVDYFLDADGRRIPCLVEAEAEPVPRPDETKAGGARPAESAGQTKKRRAKRRKHAWGTKTLDEVRMALEAARKKRGGGMRMDMQAAYDEYLKICGLRKGYIEDVATFRLAVGAIRKADSGKNGNGEKDTLK